MLDEADVRARCAEYVAAFGAGSVAYSAKAGLTVGAGRWIAGEGLGCYVASAAELRTALLSGFRPAHLVLCGRTKSITDLEAAYACGAAIVVGSIAEVATVVAGAPIGQRVLVRVLPSAGRRCRYGLPLGSSTALAAIGAVPASPNLVLAGLDCSIGGADEAQRAPVSAVRLPADVVVGDLVAVAGTGAYHHRRETFVGRPPVLGVADGKVRTLVRRETLKDLLRRTA